MGEEIEVKLSEGIPPEFSQGKNLPKICYLCGKELPVNYTEDHLPPKGLFPKQDKPLLLRVFACKPCHVNRHISMDDEYFRNCIEIWVGKEKMPAEVVSRRKRAWAKRPLQGIDMLANTEPVFIESGSGIYQPRYLVKIKSRRINSVLERIAKGFHFARWKERIPTIANVYFNESSVYTNSIDRLLYHIPYGFVLIPGKFVVRHWHIRGGSLCASNWIFKFYEGPEFFVKFEWFT